MKWNEIQILDLVESLFYITHLLGRHKDHYNFKKKNAEMNEMK
jgi:hypothetical protein